MDYEIAAEIREVSPETRIAFVEADVRRVGCGHSGLDALRRRVVPRAAEDVLRAASGAPVREFEAFGALMTALGENADDHGLACENLARRIADRQPFPVTNDAIDVTRLLSLFYRLPCQVHDRSGIEGRVRLEVAGVSSLRVPGVGSATLHGALLFRDDRGWLGGPTALEMRESVTDRTRELAFLCVVPEGVNPALAADVVRRAQNWLQSILDARIVAAGVRPESGAATAEPGSTSGVPSP